MRPPHATPWVLLRGLTREAGHWGDFAQRLQQASGSRPVVCLDLPGNGQRRHQVSPTRLAEMTAAARAQLKASGCEPPYRLLAVSLGGMVAIDWAARHPGELTQLVLVNTSLRGVNRWTQRLRPGAWPALARLLLPGQSALQREHTVFRLTCHRPGAQALTVAHWADLRRQRPVSAPNALRQLLAAWRFRVPSAAPAVPMLLLASTQDRLVDVACSRALAARWDIPLTEHPWAGHDLPLDDPDWVVAQLRGLMDKNGGFEGPCPP